MRTTIQFRSDTASTTITFAKGMLIHQHRHGAVRIVDDSGGAGRSDFPRAAFPPPPLPPPDRPAMPLLRLFLRALVPILPPPGRSVMPLLLLPRLLRLLRLLRLHQKHACATHDISCGKGRASFRPAFSRDDFRAQLCFDANPRISLSQVLKGDVASRHYTFRARFRAKKMQSYFIYLFIYFIIFCPRENPQKMNRQGPPRAVPS
jgi:hypothetical protein